MLTIVCSFNCFKDYFKAVMILYKLPNRLGTLKYKMPKLATSIGTLNSEFVFIALIGAFFNQ